MGSKPECVLVLDQETAAALRVMIAVIAIQVHSTRMVSKLFECVITESCKRY